MQQLGRGGKVFCVLEGIELFCLLNRDGKRGKSLILDVDEVEQRKGISLVDIKGGEWEQLAE